MGRLFHKNDFYEIMNKINDFKIKATIFCEILDALENELYRAKTKEAFYNVVQKIINENKKVHFFLSEFTQEADQELISKVMALRFTDPNINKILTLLDFMQTATMDILAKKELLSLEEALFNLTEEQQVEFLFFVERLKGLRLISDLLAQQEEMFKERLRQVTSFEEINDIEIEIENKNQLLENALTRFLPNSNDEVVVERIVDFMKKNTHLHYLLDSFHPQESLMDYIMDARATLIAKYDEYTLSP